MQTKHHIEQEIKLTAPDQQTLDQVLNCKQVALALIDKPPLADSENFASTYYDTHDWALRKMKWSLRTRFEGERHVCTLKRNSTIIDGLSVCEEIEQTTKSGFKCVADIPAGKIADEMNTVFDASMILLPTISVNMRRTKRILKFNKTIVELVTDAGEISANNKSSALYEVELELIQGDLLSKAVKLFIEHLTSHYALKHSTKSKHQIGLAHYNLP